MELTRSAHIIKEAATPQISPIALVAFAILTEERYESRITRNLHVSQQAALDTLSCLIYLMMSN